MNSSASSFKLANRPELLKCPAPICIRITSKLLSLPMIVLVLFILLATGTIIFQGITGAVLFSVWSVVSFEEKACIEVGVF